MSLTTLLAAVALVATPVLAQASAAEPVLTVEGATTMTYTREELAALPQHAITQTTDYSDGEVTFSGPLARDVLTAPAGATIAVLTALNDYSVEAPLDDFARFDAILAIAVDGKPLSRRDKGPIWMMYPMAEIDPAQKSVYDNRLIWQLVRVSFR